MSAKIGCKQIIRQGLGGGGPQRLIRALGIESGNPIRTYEQRSSFLPSIERAPHHTSPRIPEGQCSPASTLSMALPNPLSPLLVTRRHIPKLFQGGHCGRFYSPTLPQVCVCLLLVRAKAKGKGNKYGATRSAGDYRRKVQLARLCALAGVCAKGA